MHPGYSALQTKASTKSVVLLNAFLGTWRHTQSRSDCVLSRYRHRHIFLFIFEHRRTRGGRSSANLDFPMTEVGFSFLKQQCASKTDILRCYFCSIFFIPPSLLVRVIRCLWSFLFLWKCNVTASFCTTALFCWDSGKELCEHFTAFPRDCLDLNRDELV